MLKLPLRKLFFIVKLCFLFVLVLITLSLFEYWRGGKRATRAVILDPEEDEYERQILEDEARIVPGLGEGGRAAYLTGEDKRLGEEAEKKYAVNTYLSDRIAYNRTLRDFRNPACERVTYDAELPSASVIIIFHNEPYSVVVRTIWSVLNTARRDQPWHRRANYLESGTGRVMKLGYPGQPSDSEHVYLKEIILVDDNSTLPELRGKLARYIRTRLPEMVRMLRLPDRIGLTRARLAGARYASGEVLIFLDAHCEGVTDWMRPLLQRIKDSPTAVVIPIIDVIENKDFFYSVQDPAIFQGLMRARVTGARTARGDVLVFLDAHCEAEADWLRPLLQRLSHKRDAVVTPVIDVVDQTSFHLDGEDPIQVGGFTFVGHFTWIDVPEREKKRRGSNIAPTWSPTMAGGLFAIRRSYYWELGAYDEQMAGWGGENLEMSFRIWQCGGTLETIPCSRVGHVFRSFHPYGLPAATDTHGINTARMAEVWMDEYAELFYLHRPDLRKNPIIGDVTHRKILREKLHCKSFQWFLDNVYQEKFVPVRDSRAYGRVQNPSSHLCLDTMQREGEASPLGFYPCHNTLTATQYLSLSLTGQLRDEERCAEVEFIRNRGSEQDDESLSRLVIMVGCKENTARSKWTYNERTQQLQHSDSGLCLDTRGARAGDDARAAPCAHSAEPTQRWAIDYTTGAASQKEKPNLLPVELEDRLRKLGRQRRKSRSLLSAETNANESGEVPPHSGDSSPPGEARQRARSGKHKHKSRSKKKPKKKVKNKFIVTVERELENHTVEHLEMDIHCQHKRLYPNNSFVRDLVTILNDRNIRVINNGRVFEKNRVTELGRKDPYAVHHKEKEADTPPPEPEDDAPIETTEAPTSPPQHILTPPAPASAPAPAPPKHSHPMLQPFAEVTTPHATETRRPSKKRHRKKSKRTKEPPRIVYPQSDERADSLEDSPMVLRERGGDASDLLVSIGRVNGSSARLGSLERERDIAHVRDSQAYPKRRPTEPDFIRPLDSDSDLRYMEDHARGHLKAGAEHGFKEVKLERPRKKEKRRGKSRAQVLNDIQGRVLEPAEDLLRRDHWSGLKEKPGPDTQDWTKDTDIQDLHDLSIKDKDEDILDVRESERDTPKRSKVWKGRQDPHDAVESFVFKDVWNDPEVKEARAGAHFGPKVTELAREVLKDYDEMHPRAVSDEAGADKQALRVLLKSNVTFNLGDELLNWRRSKDNELMIPSGSEASDSSSDESPAV